MSKSYRSAPVRIKQARAIAPDTLPPDRTIARFFEAISRIAVPPPAVPSAGNTQRGRKA